MALSLADASGSARPGSKARMYSSSSAHVHHCTPLPFRFFGRAAELRLLDEALASHDVSLAAFIGPGGQGKTAIVQHWLERIVSRATVADGVFFWSFYR